MPGCTAARPLASAPSSMPLTCYAGSGNALVGVQGGLPGGWPKCQLLMLMLRLHQGPLQPRLLWRLLLQLLQLRPQGWPGAEGRGGGGGKDHSRLAPPWLHLWWCRAAA